MTINEVKKALYRQNPIAKKTAIDGYYYHYLTHLKHPEAISTAVSAKGLVPIRFEVPIQDMGATVFGEEVEAKYLIRWMHDFTK